MSAWWALLIVTAPFAIAAVIACHINGVRVAYWTWKPWRWRFYYVRNVGGHGFSELLVGPVSFLWAVDE